MSHRSFQELPQLAAYRTSEAAGRGAADMHIPLGDASFSSWRVRMEPIVPHKGIVIKGHIEEMERTTVEKTGRTLDKLRAHDLKDNAPLQSQLAGLRLSEYFDSHGSLRFRRLGLTYAAKQLLPGSSDEGITKFGSSSHESQAQLQDRTTAKSSANAFFLSTLTVERDKEQCKKWSDELYNSVPPSQRLQVQDVLQRQLEVVFSEVPQFQKFFPRGMDEKYMLPLDFTWEHQLRQVRDAENAVLLFKEKDWSSGLTMGWMFTREETLILSQITGLWTRALRPRLPSSCIDRSTFCRLILDLGLVDQVRVPFFWAVSLFDKDARYLRCCSVQEASSSSTLPLVSTVNNWLLICILDTIIRKLFDASHRGPVHRDIRTNFLHGLFDIARHKLPAHIIQESGLEARKVTDAINLGTEIGYRPESGGSGMGRSSRGSSAHEGGMAPSLPTAPVQTAGSPIGEDLMRSPTLLSMLVEPEVLHVVTQYEPVLRKLHACYADEGSGITNGHMTYAGFLQFCIDFHLTPALVSSHFLKDCYQSARCIEMCGPRDLHQRWLQSKLPMDLRDKIQRILRHGLKCGQLALILHSLKLYGVDGPKHPPQGRRGSFSKVQKARTKLSLVIGLTERHSVHSASQNSHWPGSAQPGDTAKSTNIAPRTERSGSIISTSGAPSRRASAKADANIGRRVSQKSLQKNQTKKDLETPAPTVEQVVHTSHEAQKVDGPEPWASAVTAARVALEPKPARVATEVKKQKALASKFGVSAFAETLCRISFTYLATYGNNPQMSSSSHVRIVWLISYLRCVLSSLTGSFEKRILKEGRGAGLEARTALLCDSVKAFTGGSAEKEKPNGIVHESLRKALLLVRAPLLENPPQPGTQLLAPITVRPGLPETAHGDALAIQKQRRRSLDVGAAPIEVQSPVEERHASKGRRGSTGRQKSKRLTQMSHAIPQSVLEKLEPPPPTPPHEPMCVVDGICCLCKGSASVSQWGNPRCPGCSIVDMLPFKNHLLKKLLVDGPEQNLKALVAEPPLKTCRHSLTPPPMGTSHALRRQAHPPPSTQGRRPTLSLATGGYSPRAKRTVRRPSKNLS